VNAEPPYHDMMRCPKPVCVQAAREIREREGVRQTRPGWCRAAKPSECDHPNGCTACTARRP
jgi:hypothetical protein